MSELTVEVYEADGTTLVDSLDVSHCRDLRGTDILSQPGEGAVELRSVIDGNVANPDLSLIQKDRILRFLVDGDPIWQLLISETDEVALAPPSEGEEAGEVHTITGPGVMAVLDKVRWHPDAGTGNQPFHPTRWLNFAARRLRDADPFGPHGVWADAVNQDPDYDDANYFGRSEGYIDTSGLWVGARDSRTLFAPAGIWFFRGEVTLGAEYDTLLQGAWDDEGELWIDDVPMLRAEGIYKGKCVEARQILSAATHQVSGWCRNLNALRTGVIFSGWSVTDGMADTLLFRADASWLKVLEYPAKPPGFTPTEVIRLGVDEANDRGQLPDVDVFCNFISASDTDHQPLQEVTDIAVKAPGDSLLTTVLMLGETYLDLGMSPTGLELNAWVRGTRGNAA